MKKQMVVEVEVDDKVADKLTPGMTIKIPGMLKGLTHGVKEVKIISLRS